MVKIGLRQLLERYIRINKVVNALGREYGFNTYKRIAKLSRHLDALPAEIREEFTSATEKYKSVVKDLNKIKLQLVTGTVLHLENLLDLASRKASRGEDCYRVEKDFYLLAEYGLPKSYKQLSEDYCAQFDNTVFSVSDSYNPILEAA